MADEIKKVSALTKEEALVELAVLAESVEFDEEWGEDSKLADLKRLVKEGREALAEESEEDEEDADESDEDSEDDGETDEDEEGDEDNERSVSVTESGPKGKGIHVFNQHGKYVRTYSAKVHGKDYAKLAEEFLGKQGREKFGSKEVK